MNVPQNPVKPCHADHSDQTAILYKGENRYPMELSVLGVKENRIKALAKRDLCTVEDIQRFFPRKYHDFTSNVELLPLNAGRHVAVVGELTSVSTKKTNNILMVKAKVLEPRSEKVLHIIWIGSYYLYKVIQDWESEKVIVCGELSYNEEYHSFHMKNPLVFDRNIEKNLCIHPIYKKMSGISEEYMDELIVKALEQPVTETIPEDMLKKYGLMPLRKALFTMHHPKSMQYLEQAKKRFVYEELLSFATKIEYDSREISKGTIYNVKTTKNTQQYISSLPYELTASQKKVFAEMKENAYNGIRINALIQGDVGSGKTVTAFLMMFAMADSGYQSVLMAPTVILAKQHYEKLSAAAEAFGYQVAFLSSETKAREKKEIIKGIETGAYQFIVGTHSVMNDSIPYKNLALAVIDEEHKFGVAQRNIVTQQSKFGMHKISMSATPIPRTLAETIYGNNVSVYDLEVPAIRKPIQTAIFNHDLKIYEFIKGKIDAGQQVYVVCPFIEDPEEKYDVQTIENTHEQYMAFFEPHGISVESITGKMDKRDVDQIIGRFKSGEVKILISTTIIEVGVDVPNANIIVINNAERFGLAGLHQLRGRVGRGKDQGYCILKSAERENPRLQIMCRTNNGFEIAKEDMLLRGTGDILGTEQSGQNEYINLILQYPNMYEFCKKDAKILADRGISM